jgi:multidrug resistance efflux pump
MNIELAKQERIAKVAEINSKKAEVQMNADLAANGIESGIIRAPFDGIILSKYLDIG